MKKSSLLLVLVAALIAIALRLIDRPLLNFSAMGALALLCGAAVRPAWLALAIPLGARVLTDVILELRTGHGFYGSIAFDYIAYGVVVGIGSLLQPKHLFAAFGAGLATAATFFLISNLGVWCMPHEGQFLYPRTVAGLRDCFVMALPFARGTVMGDVGFSMVFFGVLQFLAAQQGSRESLAAVQNSSCTKID